jgi:hypothetical protein
VQAPITPPPQITTRMVSPMMSRSTVGQRGFALALRFWVCLHDHGADSVWQLLRGSAGSSRTI